MNLLLRCCLITILGMFVALPLPVSAEESRSYSKDAEYSEGTPPMIPHRFEDTSNGEYCLGCHKTGISGAPLCPHPVRLSCTGCHAQGEIRAIKPTGKESKKK